MLQQLILSNGKIVSSPEPWQMLSLIHTFKITENKEGFNPNYASINFTRYLSELKGGLLDYKHNIKNLALKLYGDRVEDGQYFLDKTPRYYHIIEELYDMFPEAKFVFLVRNPLSVFASILDYNFKGDFIEFLKSSDRLDDLFLAPKFIQRSIERHENAILIRYEDIVKTTNKTLKNLFDYLGFEQSIKKEYKIQGAFSNSQHVDTKSLNKHNEPVESYLDSWKSVIDTKQKKKLAKQYLKKLGLDNPYFNYNLRDIYNQLENHMTKRQHYFSIPFNLLSQKEENLSTFQLIKKRVLIKLQSKIS
ncbi:MAG: hypothetical protein CMO82_08590 [Winogradskyella sp.]|nr:hypothetical protein [Winogradskyella sp.]|tara:strand:+ start:4723 stop:5637 length:915 start_codon:yes stop_codon:yes gene_type:complete